MKPTHKPKSIKFVHISPRERELYRAAEKAYNKALRKAERNQRKRPA